MDKFDLQIATAKPTTNSAQLNERQFMKKLTRARRTLLLRRALMAIMGLSLVAIVAGALRRDVLGILSLTFHYLGDLPSMLSEYSRAYAATISWPSVVAMLFLVALGVVLVRSRGDLTAARSRHTYQYAGAMAGLALVLGITGLVGSPAHAQTQQEALRRSLNERGHLEVRVNGQDYELYAKSQASDESIRGQAYIQDISKFDISKAYPELQTGRLNGSYNFVAEVRSINPKTGCVFYVERRLMGELMDANASCIYARERTYYLTHDLKPTKAPDWKVGQAIYTMLGQIKAEPSNHALVVVLLEGKADQYVAHGNNEKLVPKGKTSIDMSPCGIGGQDSCPNLSSILVLTNKQTLPPRQGSNMTKFFGKLTAADNSKLQIVTESGQQITIATPRNIIADFNGDETRNQRTGTGAVQVLPGDHLYVHIGYADGTDLSKLSLSDVYMISLAVKSGTPDPLSGKTYDKQKSLENPDKY